MSTNKKLYKLSINQIKNITAKKKNPLLASMYRIEGHLAGLDTPSFVSCEQMMAKAAFALTAQTILG